MELNTAGDALNDAIAKLNEQAKLGCFSGGDTPKNGFVIVRLNDSEVGWQYTLLGYIGKDTPEVFSEKESYEVIKQHQADDEIHRKVASIPMEPINETEPFAKFRKKNRDRSPYYPRLYVRVPVKDLAPPDNKLIEAWAAVD